MASDVYEEMKCICGNSTSTQNADLFLNEVTLGKNLSVTDPWYGGEEDFKHAYKLMEEACDKIILKYGRQNPGPLSL